MIANRPTYALGLVLIYMHTSQARIMIKTNLKKEILIESKIFLF